MSKELNSLVDGYSDLLIQVLNLKDGGEMLLSVLSEIDSAQTLIGKGLLR